MDMRIGRYRIKLRRRWPFVLVWRLPPSDGWLDWLKQELRDELNRR